MVTLIDADRAELIALLMRDPIVNAVLASRVYALRTFEQRRFGGALLGVRDGDGGLAAVVFAGGNLLPVAGAPDTWATLAGELATRPRPCSSFVGRADAVGAFWRELSATWGPARLVRERQLLLVTDPSDARLPDGDPRLHVATPAEFGAYLPAAVAMFTEELDASPLIGDGHEYRARIAGLLGERRALTITDDAGVLFKADLGAVTPQTCQVQGVWVRPDARGQGVGAAAMAGVLRHGLSLAPTVSLYVNDFNEAAVRMYARLGMHEVAELSTILF